jgi:hypothetical protein
MCVQWLALAEVPCLRFLNAAVPPRCNPASY